MFPTTLWMFPTTLCCYEREKRWEMSLSGFEPTVGLHQTGTFTDSTDWAIAPHKVSGETPSWESVYRRLQAAMFYKTGWTIWLLFNLTYKWNELKIITFKPKSEHRKNWLGQSRAFVLLLRHKTLSLKIPYVEFDVSVSVDKMQLLTHTSKIQNEYLS